MYLIASNSQLVGYTYNKLALAAFIKVCKTNGVECSYKEISDNLPQKKVLVKTKEHIENLVTWYSRQPDHTCYYHHYVRMNTKLILHISLDFRRAVHKEYYNLYLQSLTEDLNDLLYSTITNSQRKEA